MYEVFWNKKPPLLPIQRRLTARFEKDVKEELKVSRTELAIPLRTPAFLRTAVPEELLTPVGPQELYKMLRSLFGTKK